MSKHRKLLAVIHHEFLTTVKQPSFWIALFVIPTLFGVIMLISILTNTEDKVDLEAAKDDLKVTVIDKSGLIAPAVKEAYKLQTAPATQQPELERSVREGKLDGLIVYPRDVVASGSYQLFADKTDKHDADAIVTELGKATLQQSLLVPLGSPQLSSLAISGGMGQMQSFVDGQPSRSFAEYIVPGAFLLIFYTVLIFSVGYALSSVSEEKENRSIEMVLSYVKPQTLIMGKLLNIILVTLLQILTFCVMGLAAYGIFRVLGKDINLPFELSDLTFVPSEIALGVGFVVVGFIFYVALMAMIGAIFPSSKEANNFSTVFYLLPAVPFWGINAIIAQEPNLFAHILTYFPLTAPTTVLLRNTVGNISPLEGAISLAILTLTACITIALAAKAFRLGTLEYTDRIKFSALLSRSRE